MLGSFLPNLDYTYDWDRAEEAHQNFLDLYGLDADDIPLLVFTAAEGEEKGTAALPFSVPSDEFIAGRRARTR